MQSGEKFERQVESVYLSLGYKVTRDIQIAGQQVDLLLEKPVPGVGLLKSIVECKFLTSGKVSNQHVHEFAAFLSSCHALGVSKGVMVTNGDFTRFAKDAAKPHNSLNLVTLKQLKESVLPVEDGLQAYISAYQETDIFTDFISLSASDSDSSTNSYDALNTLSNFGTTETGSMAVLGDFGSGKTTVLERVRYNLALSYLAGENTRIPVFYRLRDLLNFDNFPQFVIESFHQNFMFRPAIDLIERKNSVGEFCHIFDGFDEIGVLATTDERYRYIRILYDFIGDKVTGIISSRPTYFFSKLEYRGLFSQEHRNITRKNPMLSQNTGHRHVEFINRYLEHSRIVTDSFESRKFIELRGLTKPDISKFLASKSKEFTARLGVSSIDVEEFIYSIYDLGDLIKRPILLRMITDTVLGGQINLGSSKRSFGPYELYDLYTWASFCREHDKNRQKRELSPSMRQRFVQLLSLEILERRQLSIDGKDLRNLILDDLDEIDANISNMSVDEVIADLQVSSFLKFSSDSSFRFAHRSFMEFFVAQAFCRSLSHRQDNPFDEIELPGEALYFASSYIAASAELQISVRKLEQELVEPRLLRRNITASMLACGSNFRSLTFWENEIRKLVVKKQSILGYQFQGTSFSECTLEHVEFKTTDFCSVSFTDSKIEGASFIECKVELALRDTTLTDSKARDSTLRLRLSNTRIHGFRLENCTVASGGVVLLDQVQMNGGTFGLVHSRDAQSSSRIDGSNFVGVDFADLAADQEFRPCHSLGRGNEFDTCFFADCTASLDRVGDRLSLGMVENLSLKNCFGVLRLRGEVSDEALLGWEDKSPHLLFLRLARLSVIGSSREQEQKRIANSINRINSAGCAERVSDLLDSVRLALNSPGATSPLT